MAKFKLPLLCCLIVFAVLIALFPKNTQAEIATTTDWIGLFASGTLGNTFSSTANNGSAWIYTSSCLQTAGSTPKLANLTGCDISTTGVSPGLYELRLYANDRESSEALIDKSNLFTVGLTINDSGNPTNPTTCTISGDKMTVTLNWPALTAGEVTNLSLTRSSTGGDGFRVFNFDPYRNPNPVITFTDTVAAVSGSTYTYYLTAYNAQGSAASVNEVRAAVTENYCTLDFPQHGNSAPVPTTAPPPISSANCPTSNTGSRIEVENGFLSSTGTGSNFLIPTTTPGILSSPCIMGNPAAIPQFSLLSYDEIKSLYFDQSKLPSSQKITFESGNKTYDSTKPADTIFDLSSNDMLYRIRGNLTISSEFRSGASGDVKTGVFFVDGDLLIKTNTNKLTYTSSTGGLVFIVRGDVFIDENMVSNNSNQSVDAFFILAPPSGEAGGQFCSASVTDAGGNTTCTADGNTDDPLIIKGSVVSLGSSSPQFVRKNGTNASAAEEIIFQPKYLIILKDIFARNLSVWNEIQ